MNEKVTVQTIVQKDLPTVWRCWTEPLHIMDWTHASDDWECPHAENDLRLGGKLMTRFAAKDKSASFDFVGTYTEVIPMQKIAYTIEDGRIVVIVFEETDNGVLVTETFEVENENPIEMQRTGWQAILDNFKKHAESAH